MHFGFQFEFHIFDNCDESFIDTYLVPLGHVSWQSKLLMRLSQSWII